MKKIIAIILAIAAPVCIFSSCSLKLDLNAVAIKYKEVEGGLVVSGYTDKTMNTDIVIPDEVDGKPVVAVLDFGICNAESLVKITIGKNVKAIGTWAFTNNQHLREFAVDPANENFTAKDGILFTKDMTELYQKYQSDGFQTGKDYWILTPTLEEGYPEISVVSSTTTQLLVDATNNTMVVPGNGETKLLDYDPQNPGYLCKSTSTSNAMTVSVPGNANVNTGDILRIYGVSRTGWLISTNLSSDTYNTYTSDGYIDITITDRILAQVKAGFTISGNSFTVTYVTVRTPNQ